MRTLWLVSLLRVSESRLKVTVLQDRRQRDASPASFDQTVGDVSAIRALVDRLKPHRMVQLILRHDGELAFTELEAPEGENEDVRARRVIEELEGSLGSAHYSTVGPAWEEMAAIFDSWREQWNADPTPLIDDEEAQVLLAKVREGPVKERLIAWVHQGCHLEDLGKDRDAQLEFLRVVIERGQELRESNRASSQRLEERLRTLKVN